MESALTTPINMAASRERTVGLAAEDFEHLVRTHQRRIFRVLFALVRDRDVADSLTQDCFLRAYQKRTTFRGEASVETWLIRIAVNLARDHARNRRWAFWQIVRRPRAVEPEAAPEIEVPDLSPSAERSLLARERLAAAEAALERLSRQQRTTFSLRFFEEMSLEEIGEAMGVEVGTVKAHLFRAVSAVRRELKEQR